MQYPNYMYMILLYTISHLHSHTYTPGLNVAKVDYLYGSSVFLILLSLLYLAVELVQVVRRRKQYFTEGENYVQVLTFVFSIIFVSGFGNECWCAPPWQWQFGALALFLAWFNLVILLKDMPFTGIPINMLFNICLTFVKLVFLPVLLILSFALPFYMLFVRDINSIEVHLYFMHACIEEFSMSLLCCIHRCR